MKYVANNNFYNSLTVDHGKICQLTTHFDWAESVSIVLQNIVHIIFHILSTLGAERIMAITRLKW